MPDGNSTLKVNKGLSPAYFANSQYSHNSPNYYAQNLLLKAMAGGVTDPKELARITGMRSAAEVFRTLDKMVIRKEFHQALAVNGIDLNFIVNGIKDLAVGAEKDETRLHAFQTLLKSLGLDKYEKESDEGKGWEEAILQINEGGVGGGDGLNEPYTVEIPEAPKFEQAKRVDEKSLADEIYGNNTTNTTKA